MVEKTLFPGDACSDEEKGQNKGEEGELCSFSSYEQKGKHSHEIEERLWKGWAYNGIDIPPVQPVQCDYGHFDDLSRQAQQVVAEGCDEACKGERGRKEAHEGNGNDIMEDAQGIEALKMIKDNGKCSRCGRDAEDRQGQEPPGEAIGLREDRLGDPADEDDKQDTYEGQLEGRREQGMGEDHEYDEGAQEQRVFRMPASLKEKGEHIDDYHDRRPYGGKAGAGDKHEENGNGYGEKGGISAIGPALAHSGGCLEGKPCDEEKEGGDDRKV